jgi:DNA-directed RNA polymerase specialized sigma24 family protein
MTDEEIFLGSAKGDEDALRELFASTWDHVGQVCALFLEGDEKLPSAVVGTYARAYHALGLGLAPELPLKTWLSVLATRECFPILQRLRQDYEHQTRTLESLSGSIPTLVEISDDPKERVNFMIRGDIDDIPEQHRDVLAMSELEGLHPLALAKRRGHSWTAAMNSLIQARHALAKQVKESFGL